MGWSEERLAKEIGMNPTALSGIEGLKKPTPFWIADCVRDLTGVDPYVLAYCRAVQNGVLTGNILTDSVKNATIALIDAMDKELAILKQSTQRIPGWWTRMK